MRVRIKNTHSLFLRLEPTGLAEQGARPVRSYTTSVHVEDEFMCPRRIFIVSVVYAITLHPALRCSTQSVVVKQCTLQVLQ